MATSASFRAGLPSLRALALGTAVALAASTGWAQPAEPTPAPTPTTPPPSPATPSGPRPLAESLSGAATSEYDAGRLAFQAGDYATASVKFASAHDKSHDARLLFNAPGAKEIAAAITPNPSQGRLLVAAGPKDTIAIDGRVVAIGKWEGEVPSGSHTVRVTGQGMRPYAAEIVLKDDELRRLDATLTSDQLAPSWAFVAGGGVVVVAAGGAGGAYLLLRDDKEEARPPVQGTLASFSLPLLR